MNYPANYPNQKDDFDLRKFLNAGRSATQNSFGAPSFKYIKPGDPKPPHWLNRLSRIEPIIGEVKERAKFSNAYITPALFNLGGKDTKENICGFWGWVIDEDTDKGITAILPPGFTPTFTLQSSVTGKAINRQHWFIFTRILSPKEGETIIGKINQKCSGDDCGKNIAQYFRLPGGLNHPTEKKIADGRHPDSQRVTIIGEGCPIDPDALSRTLDAMQDHPAAAKRAAVDVGATVDPTTTAALLQRIREKDGQLFDLMQLESTPGDVRPDRSKHFAFVNKRLFEVGLSVDEVTAVAIGAPFAVKFSGREAQRVAREYEIWIGDQEVKARAANSWKNMVGNVVPHPAAYEPAARSMNNQSGQAKSGGVSLPPITSAAELQHKKFEPIQWLVHDLLCEGCTILGGRPKMGKSWLALDLAFGITSGSKVMGRDCAQGDVLYCALEDNQRRLKARMETIATSVENWPRNLYAVTEWLKGEDAIKQFGLWSKQVPNPRLIIVDTLKKIKKSPNGNKSENYADDYDAVGMIQEFYKQTGISILLITHTRKEDAEDPFDTVSGTLGQTGAVDNILVMKKEKSGAKALYATGRDMEEYSHAISFDKSTCRWGIIGSADDFSLGDTHRKIMEYLGGQAEAVGLREISNALEMNEERVKSGLRRLVDRRRVVMPFKGKYLTAEHPTF